MPHIELKLEGLSESAEKQQLLAQLLATQPKRSLWEANVYYPCAKDKIRLDGYIIQRREKERLESPPKENPRLEDFCYELKTPLELGKGYYSSVYQSLSFNLLKVPVIASPIGIFLAKPPSKENASSTLAYTLNFREGHKPTRVIKEFHIQNRRKHRKEDVIWEYIMTLKAGGQAKPPVFATLKNGEEWAYLVMKRQPGLSLHELLNQWQRGSLTLSAKDCLKLSLSLLEANQRLWKRDILHRDLKPRNIIVNWPIKGRVELSIIDYGLSCFFSKPDTDLAGTPLYAAPELLLDKASPSKESDLFSLGVIMADIFSKRSEPYFATEVGMLSFRLEGSPQFNLFPDNLKEELNPNQQERIGFVIAGLMRVEPERRLDLAMAIQAFRGLLAEIEPSPAVEKNLEQAKQETLDSEILTQYELEKAIQKASSKEGLERLLKQNNLSANCLVQLIQHRHANAEFKLKALGHKNFSVKALKELRDNLSSFDADFIQALVKIAFTKIDPEEPRWEEEVLALLQYIRQDNSIRDGSKLEDSLIPFICEQNLSLNLFLDLKHLYRNRFFQQDIPSAKQFNQRFSQASQEERLACLQSQDFHYVPKESLLFLVQSPLREEEISLLLRKYLPLEIRDLLKEKQPLNTEQTSSVFQRFMSLDSFHGLLANPNFSPATAMGIPENFLQKNPLALRSLLFKVSAKLAEERENLAWEALLIKTLSLLFSPEPQAPLTPINLTTCIQFITAQGIDLSVKLRVMEDSVFSVDVLSKLVDLSPFFDHDFLHTLVEKSFIRLEEDKKDEEEKELCLSWEKNLFALIAKIYRSLAHEKIFQIKLKNIIMKQNLSLRLAISLFELYHHGPFPDLPTLRQFKSAFFQAPLKEKLECLKSPLANFLPQSFFSFLGEIPLDKEVVTLLLTKSFFQGKAKDLLLSHQVLNPEHIKLIFADGIQDLSFKALLANPHFSPDLAKAIPSAQIQSIPLLKAFILTLHEKICENQKGNKIAWESLLKNTISQPTLSRLEEVFQAIQEEAKPYKYFELNSGLKLYRWVSERIESKGSNPELTLRKILHELIRFSPDDLNQKYFVKEDWNYFLSRESLDALSLSLILSNLDLDEGLIELLSHQPELNKENLAKLLLHPAAKAKTKILSHPNFAPGFEELDSLSAEECLFFLDQTSLYPCLHRGLGMLSTKTIRTWLEKKAADLNAKPQTREDVLSLSLEKIKLKALFYAAQALGEENYAPRAQACFELYQSLKRALKAHSDNTLELKQACKETIEASRTELEPQQGIKHSLYQGLNSCSLFCRRKKLELNHSSFLHSEGLNLAYEFYALLDVEEEKEQEFIAHFSHP